MMAGMGAYGNKIPSHAHINHTTIVTILAINYHHHQHNNIE